MTPNDYVDNAILYAVYKDAVDFLITEDRGIQNKAAKLKIKDRVLSIKEALVTFRKSVPSETVYHPPALGDVPVHNLSIKDPFFDSLKQDYGEDRFVDWFGRISRNGRKCWTYPKDDGSIGALLIYKDEDEAIDSIPILSKKRRLKLSTLKVGETGYKIGELFIKLAVQYSIVHGLSEIYLTHFTKDDDPLVNLVTEYGFRNVARTKIGEDVFLKELVPGKEELEGLPSYQISKIFWPSFYDGPRKKKFFVPIQPAFHDKLFIEFPGRQTELLEHSGKFIIEGNTIKKAYLCHSKLTRIRAGDLLLFYRSHDIQKLTSLGVVDEVRCGLRNKDTIFRMVAKRTVYSFKEIEEMARESTMVILFTWHFDLPKPLRLDRLKTMGILRTAPQSIVEVSHRNCLKIKSEGGIDERFAVS